MAAVAPIRLADYTAWAFELSTIHLNVDVRDTFVLINARLELQPRSASQPLALRGVELELLSVSIDGRDLPRTDYRCSDGWLTIDQPPEQAFVLETCCRIDPYNNSSLEGLYASGGMLSTQCEAEGF